LRSFFSGASLGTWRISVTPPTEATFITVLVKDNHPGDVCERWGDVYVSGDKQKPLTAPAVGYQYVPADGECGDDWPTGDPDKFDLFVNSIAAEPNSVSHTLEWIGK